MVLINKQVCIVLHCWYAPVARENGASSDQAGDFSGLCSQRGALDAGTPGMQPRRRNHKKTTVNQGRVFDCPKCFLSFW